MKDRVKRTEHFSIPDSAGCSLADRMDDFKFLKTLYETYFQSKLYIGVQERKLPVGVGYVPGWKKPSSNLPRLDTRLWPPYSGWPSAMVSSAARNGAPCRNRKARSTSTGEENCPQFVTMAQVLDKNTS